MKKCVCTRVTKKEDLKWNPMVHPMTEENVVALTGLVTSLDQRWMSPVVMSAVEESPRIARIASEAVCPRFRSFSVCLRVPCTPSCIGNLSIDA